MISLRCAVGVHAWTYGDDSQSHLPARLCERCGVYMVSVINEDWHLNGEPILKWRYADDDGWAEIDFRPGDKPSEELFEPHLDRLRKEELMNSDMLKLPYKG